MLGHKGTSMGTSGMYVSVALNSTCSLGVDVLMSWICLMLESYRFSLVIRQSFSFQNNP